MTKYLHIHLLVTLSGLVLWTTHAQQNTNPFLYQNEKQRCNCAVNKQCMEEDGACIPDKCATPYVGINCQHASVDLATPKITNVPQELQDGDDKTCLSQPVKGKVVFEFGQPIHFIWMYISTKTTSPINPQLLLYRGGVPQIVDAHIMKLNKKSILVKLHEDVLYDKLEVLNLTQDACSLELSLGRNLAISSTPDSSSYALRHEATKAIDGNDDPNHLSTCFRTLTKNNQWWKARLQNDAMVNWIELVNTGFGRCWIQGFAVTLFTSDNIELFTYKDASTNGTKTLYSFHAATKELTREVEVSLKGKNPGTFCLDHGILEFCEIYVYGEFSCPEHMYGAFCERYCPEGCNRESCDPDWGCPQGCNEGWAGRWCTTSCQFRYGDHCELMCPDGCGGQGDCDRQTGLCLDGCKNGLYPPDCLAPCEPGTFGVHCSKSCKFCTKNETTNAYACDPTTGRCLLGCDESFFGDECEDIITKDDDSSDFVVELFGWAGFVLICLMILCRCVNKREDDDYTESDNESASKDGEEEGNAQAKSTTVESVAVVMEANQEKGAGFSSSTDLLVPQDCSVTYAAGSPHKGKHTCKKHPGKIVKPGKTVGANPLAGLSESESTTTGTSGTTVDEASSESSSNNWV